jgi:hypothetical protein
MAKKASAKKKSNTRKAKVKKAKTVKTSPKKLAKTKKLVARAKPATIKKPSGKSALPSKRRAAPETFEPYEPRTSPRGRGVGASAAGQSGDIQGLPQSEDVDSESVEELTEEGQDFEAEAISGVENALDPDQGEVRTHEVPEDDVPEEYKDQ